jgi:uncharacterized membrane protein (UPF0127 family)
MSRYLHIHNSVHPINLPARVKYCGSFLCRLRGYTFSSHIEPDEGLLLVQSRDSRIDTSIHMLFVPFALTVVWIDTAMNVVDKVLAQPWHLAYFPANPARYILEIHPGRWDDYRVGDQVEFQYV